MEYTVYKHTGPTGKVYIGITATTVARRWDNGRGYRTNPYFWHSIQKYGWDSFSHEIIATGLTEEDACELERELIAKYRSSEFEFGYNQDLGGTGVGRSSESTRRKLSEVTSKQFEDESRREKQRTALRNYFKSAEARQRASEATKLYFSKEGSREKTSAAARKYYAEHPEAAEANRRRGVEYFKTHPEARKAMEIPVLQYSMSGELIAEWDSATKAAEAIGGYKSCICRACKGKLKTHRGYVWKYKGGT